jgi:trehalose synthase
VTTRISRLTVPQLGTRGLEPFAQLLSPEEFAALQAHMDAAPRLLRGRVMWHVNSTARGGGVAEMLQNIVPYLRGSGIDARWIVIAGNGEFFTVTKRIHNNLHGELGDAGDLDHAERSVYESTLQRNLRKLKGVVRPGDVVVLHDPQTAGLAGPLRRAGAFVVWRCHVGLDTPNELARRAWDFLRRYVVKAHLYVFSRAAFAWEGLEDEKIWVIPPSIDAFSPKNQDMAPRQVRAILAAAGLVAAQRSRAATFTRMDGMEGRVERRARLVSEWAPPDPGARLVLQVSRWDRLKDPYGVIEGFSRYVCGRTDAHLMLAGPDAGQVDDDPEGAAVLSSVRELCERLPENVARRVHLAALPMTDSEENAAMVNALQRHAAVVVQKSLAEGFGLTVAEAMWKTRPVVASRIGGIQDQIEDGHSGLLVRPTDLMAFGDAVVTVLQDPALGRRLGAEARRTVTSRFLDTRQLAQHADLVEHAISRLPEWSEL